MYIYIYTWICISSVNSKDRTIVAILSVIEAMRRFLTLRTYIIETALRIQSLCIAK